MKQTVLGALFIVFLGVFVPAAWSQEEAVSVTVQEESSRQLRIFREALFQGTSEDIRVEAAVELLLRNDTASWDILVTALNATDNGPARQAVCKALIKSRGLGQTLGSREAFFEPLMQYLVSASPDQATFPGEALLLYDFSQIEARLKEILQANPEQRARLNAVYALQIRPEPQALRSLIGLLDDPDAEVSRAAENALQESFGIPIGTSRDVWSDILEELKQKSPDDIRRERLLRQEMKLRQVQAERDRWQKLYLQSLDRQYDMADEPGRAQMTLELLGSDLAAIRLWALGRVAQYQAADKAPLRERLLALLADESRDVRLQTAKVLNNMSALNPAQKLLERFKLENDPEVALSMFEALGEACFFAFSPGSEVELSLDIKEETLNIAVQYLRREQTDTVRKAVEIIRKMLELNSLSADSVKFYLDEIEQRYQQAIGQNPALQADLLSVMAHLCGQGLSKPQAVKLYEDAFVEALTASDNPPLRLAALRGMIQIDPERAFALAKTNQLMRDESQAIRLLVAELSGTAGGADDLKWLLEMMNANGQTETVWQAIKNICRRQKSPFLLEWQPTLAQAANRGDYVRELLEMAEQKAVAEKAPESLLEARELTIRWYFDRKSWEAAVTYLDKIDYLGQPSPFSDTVDAEIMEIYLYAGQLEKMTLLIQNELAQADYVETVPVYDKLNGYLNNGDIPEEAKRLIFQSLLDIPADNLPNWQQFLERWSSFYEPAPVTETASEPQPVAAD